MKYFLLILILLAMYIFIKLYKLKKISKFLRKLERKGFYKYSRKKKIADIARAISEKEDIYIFTRRVFSYNLIGKSHDFAKDFVNITKGILIRNNLDIGEVYEENLDDKTLIINIDGMKCEIKASNKDEYIRNISTLINRFLTGVNSKEKIYLLDARREIVFLTDDQYAVIASNRNISKDNIPAYLPEDPI